MAWTEPKTDWVNGDRFNVSDYTRIKGNIEYVQQLINTLYTSYTPTSLISGVNNAYIPHVEFFNRIVTAMNELPAHSIEPRAWQTLRTSYVANQPAWDGAELNRIEGNLSILKILLENQKSGLRVMAFRLGGVSF